MRMRLRYALPGAQMILAACLLRWSDWWFNKFSRFDDMPSPPLPFKLCMSINAPAGPLRNMWAHYVPDSADRPLLIFTVGLLWYLVALNIESWRRSRVVLAFSWIPLRLMADLLLVMLGLLFGGWFAVEGRRYGLPLWSVSSWLWIPALLIPLLAWSLALIFFFGRDFIHCVRGRKPAQ